MELEEYGGVLKEYVGVLRLCIESYHLYISVSKSLSVMLLKWVCIVLVSILCWKTSQFACLKL